MQFQTQLRRARVTYAMVMASTTCLIMSAMTVSILSPELFWQRWPQVLVIDLCVANPVAIVLGPFVRKLCYHLYPGIVK